MENILVIVSLTLSMSSSYGGTITDVLSSYETINKIDFQHRIVRRSVTQPPSRNIGFVSHGKKFRMRLKQSRNIFDSSFMAVTVDSFGNEKPVHIDTGSFYEGYLEDDVTAHVTAHVDGDGMMTAAIDTSNESYIVEPMWRHFDNDPSHDMIVYRASDVKWNLTLPYGMKSARGPRVNTCGNNEDTAEEIDPTDSNERSRRNVPESKEAKGDCQIVNNTLTCLTDHCQIVNNTLTCRSIPESKKVKDDCKIVNNKHTCQLHLIGDYEFFQKIGRNDAKTAIYYMLQVITRVDFIYRGTCWDGIGKGVGVQVKKVTIHDGHDTSGKASYNKHITAGWNIDRLLTAFSRTDHHEYCLAHLFTYQDFQQGVIGLAYVASKKSRIGGICSKPSFDRLGGRWHNCGLTTYINWGRQLTTLEAQLVTVHEIGHNFGSRHDPERCSELTNEDGRYVMYATSVTGEKNNNDVFSECSTAYIGDVLRARRNYCLKSNVARCGNAIVEKGEECDTGGQTSKCCDGNCQFTQGSNCSDFNDICCSECGFTKSSERKVCRGAFTLECNAETYCDGTSPLCPDQPPKLKTGACNMKSTFKRGNCSTNGVCTSLCKLENLSECSCSSGRSACKVCCKTEHICEPLGDINENDGVQCDVGNGEDGLCEKGVCHKLTRKVKESFGSLLTDFTLDKAVRFMKNNIVVSVLFFSLLVWIPAGCIVNHVDKSEEKKWIEYEMMRDELVKRDEYEEEDLRRNSHVK